jgi:hypothetical protein
MSQFLTTGDLRIQTQGRWITLAPLHYRSDVFRGDIIVPPEFITDLASVPRAPFAYLITGNRARGPAVVHDWLYQHPDWEDRELADHIFYEACLCDQPELGFDAENAAITRLMWAGVRAGGWWPWYRHEKRAATLNPEWTATAAWPEAP